MLSVKLDPDLEWLLDHYVDDLARYNILRYVHDNPNTRGNVEHFANELGLRSLDRTRDALEALARAGLLEKVPSSGNNEHQYALNSDPTNLELVHKLYGLSSSAIYSEIVERLAARSLRRAKLPSTTRGSRPQRADLRH